mgnify:CR=1 FL=1
MENFRYYAFISYSSHDTAWGKQVQQKLEHYRMPATLCSQRGWQRTPIKPVFFAPTDIQPGGLTEELQERLRASRNLIVICSPHSARSEWVGKEIEFFHQIGRTKQIHFFIVEGTPHSGNPATECFNPIVETLGLPEILGANVHEKIYRWPWLNRERAYVQLVSKLLGVEFDAIWQRHRRLLVKKAAAWAIGIMAVVAALAGVWLANQPVAVEMGLAETSAHNNALPPMKNAVITMTLENETKTDSVASPADCALFTNIPHRFLDRQVHVSFRCPPAFIDMDTTLLLKRKLTLNIQRNESVYGDVRFCLWDEAAGTAVPNCRIEIAGLETYSDANGNVTLSVPLALQQPVYHISSSLPLERDSIGMPCGEYDLVLVKARP